MVRPSRRRWKQSRSWNLKQSGDGLPRADNLSFWTHFRISLLRKIRTSFDSKACKWRSRAKLVTLQFSIESLRQTTVFVRLLVCQKCSSGS